VSSFVEDVDIFYQNNLNDVALEGRNEDDNVCWSQNGNWLLGPGDYQIWVFEGDDDRKHDSDRRAEGYINVTLLEGLSACYTASEINDLSFCNEYAEWTVPCSWRVLESDTAAASDYYTFSSLVYPNASETCTSALKSYLCSFYFPVCDSNGLIGQNCRTPCLALADACGGSTCLDYICTYTLPECATSSTNAGKGGSGSSSLSANTIGAIVGAILGALCICLSVAAAAFLYRRRKRRQAEAS